MDQFGQIKEIARQAGEQNHCRLYDIYRHKDRFQVFIDKPSDDLGVTVEDCENVFHSLSFLMRAECPELLKSHRLEVSSPGLERKLREKWHFVESVGLKIKVSLFHPVKGVHLKTGKECQSSSFSGTLESLHDEVLKVKGDLQEWQAPLSEIKAAQVVLADLFNKADGSKGGAKKNIKKRKR